MPSAANATKTGTGTAPAASRGAGGSAHNATMADNDSADLKFIPSALSAKCRQLIETYHDIHGYSCLPDRLWHPETRNFIECRKDFHKIFRRAAIAKSAKKANEGFVLIATTILALEVLSSNFSGWGQQYPLGKRRADALLAEFMPHASTWLMDMYLYPRNYISPAFNEALSPPNGSDRNSPASLRGGDRSNEPNRPGVDPGAARTLGLESV
jgi:hypothetical protein